MDLIFTRQHPSLRSRRSVLRTALAGLGLALAATLMGCATAPRDAGFGEVQRTVRERTGAELEWPRDTDTRPAVRALLAAGELSPDDAARLALFNNPAMQATLAELGVAQADLLAAGLLPNPLLDATAGWTGPGRPFQLGITEDLIGILLLPARRRVAAADFVATQRRVADAALRLDSQVRAAVYTLQAAEQSVTLARTRAQTTALGSEYAERLHAAGNSTDLELALERSAGAQADLQAERAALEAGAARERLQRLLGLTGEEGDWSVASEVPQIPADDPPPEDFEAQALRQRQDLAALRSTVEAARQAAPLATSSALAGTSVGIRRERDAEGNRTSGPSATLALPIFDRGHAARLRAAARLEQAQARLREAEVAARSEVRAGAAALGAARRRDEAYRTRILPLAAEVLAQAQLRLNSMLSGVFQLLQAKQVELEAERESIEARRDYWLARCDLETALGGRLPERSRENPQGGNP